MSHHILAFQQWLEEDGKARKTSETYVSNIKHYQTFLKQSHSDEKLLLTRYLVVRYIKHLEEEKYAIASINAKLTSLLSYNKFLLEKKLVDQIFVFLRKDQVKVATGSEAMVEVFSELEVERLLEYVENRKQVTLRNKGIVYLLLYTGLRISELCSIKKANLNFQTNTLFVKGKSGKFREIAMRSDVAKAVQQYVQEERAQSPFHLSTYLFVTKRAPKMHRDAVSKWNKKVTKMIGFKVYPHKFRRTFATRLLNKGVPITTVAKLTGHSSSQVLERHYVSTSRKDKMKAVELL